MNSLHETVRGIINEMNSVERECSPVAGRQFQRLAVLAYADFLRHAPTQSEDMNRQCLAEAIVYRERAVSLGISEDAIEQSFERLRRFWIPRLGMDKTS